MREQLLLNAIDKGVSPTWVSHWANMGVRNIFNRYYKAPAIVIIKDEQTAHHTPTAGKQLHRLLPHGSAGDNRRGVPDLKAPPGEGARQWQSQRCNHLRSAVLFYLD